MFQLKIDTHLSIIPFILIGLLLSFNSKAQTYPFKNLTVETGLSQAQVLCAFQDDDGVMWFGTNGGGITKFDGKNYEYINDKDGLADNVVYCIKKHPTDGTILIGTNNGLSIYNQLLAYKKNKLAFANYTTEQGLSHNRIFTITIDNKGKVLLGTGNGVSEYANKLCKAVTINNELDNAPIFHILHDSKNNYWYSTMGMGVFKQQGESIEHFTEEQNGLSHNMVFSTYEYLPNVYWFLTGEGVTKYNILTKVIEKEKSLNEQYTYYTIKKDKKNTIWLGTDNGVIKVDNNGEINPINFNNGLCDNSIWSVFEDNESNKWFLSNEIGLSKYNNESFWYYNSNKYFKSGVVNCLSHYKNEYFIGKTNGIDILANNVVINIGAVDVLKTQKNIKVIFQIKNNEFIIGTINGIKYLKNASIFGMIQAEKHEKLNAIRSIYRNYIDQIFLGTEKGLATIKDNKIESVKGFENVKYTIMGITNFQNALWLSTDAGLIKYTGSQILPITVKDGMTEKTVRNCVPDKKGNLWIASSAGIYKFSNGKFTNISKQLSLPSKDIYSIALDSTGNIWVGLSEGLGKITELPDGTYKTKFYDKDNGFLGGVCSENAIYVDDKNHILVGTQDGLVIFQPEFDRDNTLEPFTKIRHLDLFSKETDWSQYTDSMSANGLPYNLMLPYNKNYLTFHYIGVTQSTPNKVKYQYKVKGLEGYENWIATTKTDIAFDNLPFGDYEFILKAENGEGVWNKEPLIFKFEITPPFWRTWWFYSIIAVIVLGFVYSYLQIRRAKNHILKQKEMIEYKNVALNKANTEVAYKNKQITDSINYAKRIQESFLTSEKVLKKSLKDYFILFKPRDIVSGDFYWAFDLPDRTLVVCADCTGHGIPGAFMSLIGISLLNEIAHSKGIIEPATILVELRRIIILALNPDQEESGAKDGMDIMLISIYKKEENGQVKIHYAGGNNSLCIVSNETAELIEYKGDKQPVGYYLDMKPFNQKELLVNKGDVLYMYTDGFPDQFGGDRAKKFMTKQLKSILQQNHQLPLSQQHQLLEASFKNWQGRLEQVDDVTVMGIRV